VKGTVVYFKFYLIEGTEEIKDARLYITNQPSQVLCLHLPTNNL